MSAPRFVHLRCHSEYSVVDGMVRIGDYVKRAANDRMPALALTDLANLFGAVKFYKEARGKGIKPLLGCDVWLENPASRDQASRLLLLCQNHAGYLRLCELLTLGYLTNQHRGRAELKREWLAENTGGLILLSGAAMGDVGQALLQDNLKLARELAAGWQALFPDRYYLELQRTGQPQEEAVIARTLALADELQLPVVMDRHTPYQPGLLYWWLGNCRELVLPSPNVQK